MIKIKNVCKEYKMGLNIIQALDNVSFNIESGEFVSIVGASGSGKSTLMNVLGCLDSVTNGTYFLDGDDISKLSKNKLASVRNVKIGFVFQGFNLIPALTAKENIELPLIYRKTPRSEREKLVNEALVITGLTKRAEHKPSELSGGQQQRVAIARAIAAKPPIILADEPCGNLDSKAGSTVMSILHELNRSGRTVVLITHDEKAANSAKRIIRIFDGKIIAIN